MPKHLLVDGFNVIRRDPRLAGLEQSNFYGAQQQLVQRLADYRRGTRHQVTVVFDGRRGPNAFRSHGRQSDVDIIYSSQGETADEVILDLAAGPGGRDGWLVATADAALARACRVLGVGIISPDELMQRSRPKPLPPPQHDFWHGKREERAPWQGHTRKKGNPRRLPKAQRKPSGLW